LRFGYLRISPLLFSLVSKQTRRSWSRIREGEEQAGRRYRYRNRGRGRERRGLPAMGMKFLNKKGWHTGSLRNVEKVWVAEQKEKEEQHKIEEYKKQLKEEREKAEFRAIQEQAGFKP
jgi:hypothetical protein